jgi:hypothetical protein
LKGFVAELKADRAAQKEKERREGWTKYTSLSLVFIAVRAAVATQWMGKYSGRVLVCLNDSTFHQAEASDQWSFYQAKSIKQNLYEVAREQLGANGAGGQSGAVEAKLTERAGRYEQEKTKIQEEARLLERKRDAARKSADEASRKAGSMGLAVSIYQIAIALGSICLVTKKRSLWYVAIAVAAVATAQMMQVWLS